jgi:hypothetical protein
LLGAITLGLNLDPVRWRRGLLFGASHDRTREVLPRAWSCFPCAFISLQC